MEFEHDFNLESIPEKPEKNTSYDCTLLDMLGISVAKCLLNEDLTILWANDFFYKDIGYSKEEYQTQFSSIQQYYKKYPEDLETIKSTLLYSVEKGDSNAKLTCRIPIKEGTFIWVSMTAAITDEMINGFPVFYINIYDITPPPCRKEEKEQYLEWMMEEYVGNLYISDLETYELLYLNKSACATLQAVREELLGKKCYEVIQGRTSPCPFCTNDRLREDSFYEWEFFNSVLKRTFMIKNRLIHWNGHKARIELSNDTLSTEYKLAKKDRERGALIRTMPGGFCRLDARNLRTILWYGSEFLNTIGYTKEQFEEELHSMCTYMHPDDLDRAEAIMKDIQETGENAVIETRVITHSGETRILTVTLSYVSSEDSWDGVPSFYSLSIDITQEREEQERQRRALEDAYQALRIASSAKTNFLSSMSHDIRTPMNAIVGMTAIAQANLSSAEKVGDCLNKINLSSRHLLALINEVLDMSKIESGKADLILADIELSHLIQSISDMCRSLLEEKRHKFQVIVGQVLHEKVVADGGRLQQVFINLMSNAIKYTPDGGEISLIINEISSPIPRKGWYEFIFTDNGIGIPTSYIPRIFEPFTRADDSRITKIQGTGLGMAIAENIVHMMNGTIRVKSELNVGSQIIVSLPLQLNAKEKDYDEILAGQPVLIAGKNLAVCENAALLLKKLGLRGYAVSTYEEAISQVIDAHNRGDDFFALILDVDIQNLVGAEEVKAIREQLGNRIPIIVSLEYDTKNIKETFISAGADAFITKPLFKSKMLSVLQRFCSASRAETAEAFIGEASRLDLCGKRILLAEDNELNYEIAAELLQMQGILVDWAENGKKAVDMFEQSAPGYYSAILMDIQMPVMDGYESTAAIRAIDRKDAGVIPILALTANAFVSDIGKAQNAGMNDHIAKPIDMDCLLSVLQKWISVYSD